MIIHLISSPRNLSTALMYSFHHRGDTLVVDEPFYAYYLHKTQKQHPGFEEILASMEKDPKKIIASFPSLSRAHPHLFLKDMAHHWLDIDISFLHRHYPIFLIRDPAQLITSFQQVIENPKMEDIGVRRQYELFQWVRQHDIPHLIIDSGELLKHPANFLRTVCDILGLSFTDSMVKWPKGAIPQDGVWARYWYKNIHQSEGFAKQQSSARDLPKSAESLYQEAQEYYQIMSAVAVRL